MQMYGEVEGKAQQTLNHGARWRFMLRKSPWYTLHMRLGGPRVSLDMVVVRRKIPAPAGNHTSVIQPAASYCTDYVNGTVEKFCSLSNNDILRFLVC
jgi:hypothetical protein